MNQYSLKNTVLMLDNVSVGYPDTEDSSKTKLILQNINIIEKDVVRPGVQAQGQMIAILARSGRGKSTLFKALTGLVRPTSGRVLIPNMRTDSPDDAKEVCEGDVGFVDQKYTLLRHKTVNQMLMYVLRKEKMTKQEKQEKIDSYLKEWNLWEHKDKYSSELSGGQKQRTSIIIQMISSKYYIVLDEPTSGLDVHAIDILKKYLRKILVSNEYNTIIFSTHSISFAVEMADSIYVLGFPEGGEEISTIIKHYDLKEMGLAWKEYGEEHVQLVNEIKEVIIKA